MMMRRHVLVLLATLMTSGAALAQTGGQLWVRSFEDRNGNGVRDAGEPLLTRGINVNLLNAEGVIIASALLDSSPNAAQGLVGFQLLPPGQYSVAVTSADYTATSADTFTTTVSDTGVPPVLEFGAQASAAPLTTGAGAAANAEAQTAQLALAGAASAVVMCSMVIVGIVVYLLTLRGRLIAAQAADARRSTGSMRPLRMTDTGSFRPTDTGQFRNPSDTGQFRAPSDTGSFRNPSATDTGEFRKP